MTAPVAQYEDFDSPQGFPAGCFDCGGIVRFNKFILKDSWIQEVQNAGFPLRRNSFFGKRIPGGNAETDQKMQNFGTVAPLFVVDFLLETGSGICWVKRQFHLLR